MRFRKRSGLWFYTSFITQIIAYMHCFSCWTTAIPFLGLLQIDSADLQLCQNFFQVLVFLCTDFPYTFSEVGSAPCFQLWLGAHLCSSCVCAEPRTASTAMAQSMRRNEDVILWQNSSGKSVPLLLLDSLLRVWLCLHWLLKAKPAW